jgi:inner membrane protein
MNDRGHNHQILVHINGVRTYDRARIKQDFAVLEQQDANTFIVHAIDQPDELYQVSSRPEVEHQILSERITGKVGRKITTKIESVTWMDEEILPKLKEISQRYPNAQMYLTGAVEVDEPDEINPQLQPQELVTVVKRGRKVELKSCPLGETVGLLREQWGSGQVRVRARLSTDEDRA